MPRGRFAILKTHEQFLIEFKTKQPELFNSIEILEEYKNTQQPLLIQNKYGKCLTRPNDLLRGRIPTIRSSVNKTEYWINQAKEIHGDLYNYSLVEYVDDDIKVKIISSEGVFEQRPQNHLQGRGCPLLGQYSNYKYIDYVEKGLRNKKSTSFKIYIIKCWNNNEVFYKIGKTYNTINQRYSCKKHLPYQYEIIDCIEFEKTFESGMECCKLEHELHLYYKKYNYTPTKKFGGRFECFYGLPIID